MNLKEIYEMADAENIVSHKVLEKSGLQFVESFTHHGRLHHWYMIVSAS